MIFAPENIKKSPGCYAIPHVCTVKGEETAELKELFEGFTFGQSRLEFACGGANTLVNGEADILPLYDNDYTVNVTEDGFALSGKDRHSLLYAFFTLLEMLEPYGNVIPCCTVREKIPPKMRIVHVCVFPETTLLFLKKTLRFCAFLRYTHIVIEFWGSYKYECLKELAWENAYSYEQLKPIFDEASSLGLKFIPMINHLGHASACRLISGKHVVLDRNPGLFRLFEPDGWSWNTANPDTLTLLRNMRREMLHLFPDAEMFHLGCDEVYSYAGNVDKIKAIPAYINGIAEELGNVSPIIWGDMLLANSQMPDDGNTYELNLKDSALSEYLLNGIDKRVIIADWQYGAKKTAWASARLFKCAGFDVMACPWFELNNVDTAALTANEYDLMGVLCTTWHTLNTQFPLLIYSAQKSYGVEADKTFSAIFAQGTALLRKLMPIPASYDDCGFSVKQITGYER